MAATIYKAHKTRREPPLLKMRSLGGKNTEKLEVSAVECYCSHFFLSFIPSLWDMV